MLTHDYKHLDAPSRSSRLKTGHFHLFLFLIGLLVSLGLFLGPAHDAIATRAEEGSGPPPQQGPRATEDLQLPEGGGGTPAEKPPVTTQAPTETVTVRSGDTLSAIFDRAGLSPQAWHAIVRGDGKSERLQRLRPGERIAFWTDGDGITALDYHIDRTRTLEVRREGEGFVSRLQEREAESRTTHATGTIETSLFEAGREAGLPDRTIMELAHIFGWDVDFALDIRAGDRFTVLYEERYLDGEKLGNGHILAAEFINQGRVVRAVRFTDPSGHTDYYSPEGRSMRKAFLRSPVDFRRISSRFQGDRFHPVLGKKRPHRGVDYAANVGTPIKASGDGKVIFRGWKGGYGRAIILRHGGRYTTLYGHMSRFRGGLGVGSRVEQGQVIGYVGASGLATGPHLHYEFRVDGVHRDPLKVELPKAEPIRKAYRDDFREASQPLLAQLETLQRTRVALEKGDR